MIKAKMKNEQFIKLLPLETERLIIRRSSIEDAGLMVKLDLNENVQKFLGGVKYTDIEKRIVFLQKEVEKFSSGHAGSLTVVLKENNIPIGFISFSIKEVNNNAELSFMFDYDYWHNGYCYESSGKLLEVGFEQLKLNKIFADTIKGNSQSIKTLNKLGMKLEGARREQIDIQKINKHRDFLDFGILKREYKKISGSGQALH